VPKPGTDNGSNGGIQSQLVKELDRNAFLFKKLQKNQISKEKSRSEKQTVPPDGKITNPY
jgi:hypothetical protein